HVVVGDPSRELHLPAEMLEAVGAVDQLPAEDLEGDELVELDVPGAVHGAHRAGAEQGEDLVAGGEEVALFGHQSSSSASTSPCPRRRESAGGSSGAHALAGGWWAHAARSRGPPPLPPVPPACVPHPRPAGAPRLWRRPGALPGRVRRPGPALRARAAHRPEQ